jgi:hypothetical protein
VLGIFAGIATVAAAVIACVALYVQHRSFRLTLAANLSMNLDERFNSEELRSARALAARSLKGHTQEEEAEDVFDFFDTIGLFTRRGALDDEFVHSMFFHWIQLYWSAGSSYIRMRQKDSPLLWKDFEGIYQRVLAIEKSKAPNSEDLEYSPEMLDHYLDQEIALEPTIAP